MKSTFPALAMVLLCALLIGTSLVLWGCSGQPAADTGTGLSTPATGETTSTGSSTTGSTQSTAPTSSVDAAPQPVNGGPGTPEYDGIPRPIVEGGGGTWATVTS